MAALKKHDLVFVHVEAPDEASHQGLLAEKMQAIEDFDQKIVKPVFEALQAAGDLSGSSSPWTTTRRLPSRPMTGVPSLS